MSSFKDLYQTTFKIRPHIKANGVENINKAVNKHIKQNSKLKGKKFKLTLEDLDKELKWAAKEKLKSLGAQASAGGAMAGAAYGGKKLYENFKKE